MRQRRPAVAAIALAAAAVLAAACGNAAPATRSAVHPGGSGASSMATSFVTTAGTWAVVVMGGSAASHNDFWELFIRPAGTQRWQLVTPPGVPDNGGLVAAGLAGRSLIAAFAPSQYLTYTPLTETPDGGHAWSSRSPLDAALARNANALAAGPVGSPLIALLSDGSVTKGGPHGATWIPLASLRMLAATSAGRRCALRALTAVAVTPPATPLIAGVCGRPGTAGIFAFRHGTWLAAGPAIPTALAREDITVLKLARTAKGIVALLAAGRGPSVSMLAAWSADRGRHWTTSPAIKLHGDVPASVSVGPTEAVAVALTGGAGEVIPGLGHQWRLLPPLPPRTATLALGSGETVDALAVGRTTLTVWRTRAGSTRWSKAQAVSVPIQFGSSG